MDVKEAVRTAKEYLAELFAEETITDVGLEEVVFDDASNEWNITIGFSRPWSQVVGTSVMTAALGEVRLERSYKVLRVNNISGEVKSLTDRVLKAS